MSKDKIDQLSEEYRPVSEQNSLESISHKLLIGDQLLLDSLDQILKGERAGFEKAVDLYQEAFLYCVQCGLTLPILQEFDRRADRIKQIIDSAKEKGVNSLYKGNIFVGQVKFARNRFLESSEGK